MMIWMAHRSPHCPPPPLPNAVHAMGVAELACEVARRRALYEERLGRSVRSPQQQQRGPTEACPPPVCRCRGGAAVGECCCEGLARAVERATEHHASVHARHHGGSPTIGSADAAVREGRRIAAVSPEVAELLQQVGLLWAHLVRSRDEHRAMMGVVASRRRQRVERRLALLRRLRDEERRLLLS